MTLRVHKVASLANWVFVLFVFCYVLFNMIPAQCFWFQPEQVRFFDALKGTVPALEYNRTIKRPTLIEYQVTLRRVTLPDTTGGDIVCTITEGPFNYLPVSGPVVGKDLGWWAPSSKCYSLPEGAYWAETCWTLKDPLGDLMPFLPRRVLGALTPEKSVCRSSNVFYIGNRPEDHTADGY